MYAFYLFKKIFNQRNSLRANKAKMKLVHVSKSLNSAVHSLRVHGHPRSF